VTGLIVPAYIQSELNKVWQAQTAPAGALPSTDPATTPATPPQEPSA
jgi:hypothetical protein